MNEEVNSADSRTLGQRIQEGRRAANFSQEQLGEVLEVSRQAVSKWESDAAVPELSKLIAMSRLFSCSIGELLGVEESTPPANSGELNEVQLRMAEKIAESYLEKQPKSTLPKRDVKILFALCGILLALIVGISTRVGRIDRNNQNLQRSVSNLQDSVSAQIGSVTGQISSILEEQNNLLSDKNVEVASFDPKAGTVTLRVTAMPKEYTATTQVTFAAELSDGTRLSTETAGNGGEFSAQNWTVPMDRDIQITAVLTDGDTVRTASVDTVNAAPEEFRMDVLGGWDNTVDQNSRTVQMQNLNLCVNCVSDVQMAPVSVELCIYRNQSTFPEQILPVKDAVSLWNIAGTINMENMTDYQTSFQMTDGDTVTCAVRIADNFGQTTYTVINYFYFAESGYIDCRPDVGYSLTDWTPGTAIQQ